MRGHQPRSSAKLFVQDVMSCIAQNTDWLTSCEGQVLLPIGFDFSRGEAFKALSDTAGHDAKCCKYLFFEPAWPSMIFDYSAGLSSTTQCNSPLPIFSPNPGDDEMGSTLPHFPRFDSLNLLHLACRGLRPSKRVLHTFCFPN